jgi:hypothetical protein
MTAELTHSGGQGAAWLEPGQAYREQAGGTVLLILTAPLWPGVLRCNGVPMVAARPFPCGYHSRARIDFGTALRPGRRYRDPVSGLEVRCLRGSSGYLSFSGRALTAV